MVPQAGQKIGPYEILGRLGSGGMGLVFSAWDSRLHRDVAIKILKEEFLTSSMRARFIGEARAVSRLNHPNICTIFDIGEEQDCPYLVMELLKGETLRGRMQHGPIPVQSIFQIATQVADALSVAHEQGIVHRDIKPANIVLVEKPNGSFQTKVLDFGLAKIDLGETEIRSGLTTTGMTVGTVSYMSPEQARGELLDGRSDLFSLGVVLYEMAAGKLPFTGATSALIYVQLLNHAPAPLRELNAQLPRSLEQVINTCLQKDRDDRYQSGQALAAALHKAAQSAASPEKSAAWFSKLSVGQRRAPSVKPDKPEVEAEAAFSGTDSPGQCVPEAPVLRPSLQPVDRTETAVEPSSLNHPAASADQPPSNQGWRRLFGIITALLITCGSIALLLAKHHGAAVKIAPTLSIAAVANQSGDSTLGAVLFSGLELALQQSRWIGLRDGADINSVFRDRLPAIGTSEFAQLQRIASASGAGSFVTGEVHTDGSAYSIMLHVYDSAKGEKIGDCAVTAASRERLIGAIESLSANLRSVLGEPANSIAQTSVPLNREGVGSFEALQAYASGKQLESSGRLVDAMRAFERAVGVEPQFTQAQLSLAEVFHLEEAETAAAASAAAAHSGAQNGSEHTKLLADASDALLNTGDMRRATAILQTLTKNYPNDVHGFIDLAYAQRIQGDDAAAEATSAKALKMAPQNSAAIAEAQLALLALDRTDEAIASASALKKNQPLRPANVLASFLHGGIKDAQAAASLASADDLSVQMAFASVLDASGQLDAGLVKWLSVAQSASAVPELSSTAAYAFAQAALDRALVSDCTRVSQIAQQAGTLDAGPATVFRFGMASGFCGDLGGLRTRSATLSATYPESFAVKHFYVSDLNTLLQFKSGAFADAHGGLNSGEGHDAISLTHYLRGLAYLAQNKPQPAMLEFQNILRHRGGAMLANPELYPMAQFMLSRAFAQSGDQASAARSYGEFVSLWRQADVDSPLLIEARARSVQ